ncbi:hypothetical protein PTSG_06469 [Salpingoeca rosetta]|uniref:Rabaptin coiled-coil domain-containing protein n=1 Tax=Salpingoeca rosetta (strain ATCC 50818 / BSB-021) TaxID=946362 RepID=F2UFW4_SALR5|nr:uncharacterized protein PTSG_06469 [Salpingoeca rosetta]EGD75392.1 hypothetical protein PTSG_06469 [Salpingoeca rosetta]|eukprot:XP_004991849.1 hypothetical protein PTSG_06469 [Salpingoeca rosetta]
MDTDDRVTARGGKEEEEEEVEVEGGEPALLGVEAPQAEGDVEVVGEGVGSGEQDDSMSSAAIGHGDADGGSGSGDDDAHDTFDVMSLRANRSSVSSEGKGTLPRRPSAARLEADLSSLRTALAQTESERSSLESEVVVLRRQLAEATSVADSKDEEWFQRVEQLNDVIMQLRQEVRTAKQQQQQQQRSGSRRWRRSRQPQQQQQQQQQQQNDGDGEMDMETAQRESDLLRAVVQPMELEIARLRRKLEEAKKDKPDDEVANIEKLYVREKSKTHDLQQQIGVLETQRRILTDDMQALRLELSKKEVAYTELEVTYHRANETFMEVQGSYDRQVEDLQRQLRMCGGSRRRTGTTRSRGSRRGGNGGDGGTDGDGGDVDKGDEEKGRGGDGATGHDDDGGDDGDEDENQEEEDEPEVVRLRELLAKEQNRSAVQLSALDQNMITLREHFAARFEEQERELVRQRDQYEATISTQRMQISKLEARVQQLLQRTSPEAEHGSHTALCRNYEAQLVARQLEIDRLKERLRRANADADAVLAASQQEHAHAARTYARTLKDSMHHYEEELNRRYRHRVEKLEIEVHEAVTSWPFVLSTIEESQQATQEQISQFQHMLQQAVDAKAREATRLRATIDEIAEELASKTREAEMLSTTLLERDVTIEHLQHDNQQLQDTVADLDVKLTAHEEAMKELNARCESTAHSIDQLTIEKQKVEAELANLKKGKSGKR